MRRLLRALRLRVGTAAKTMLRGVARVGFQFTLNMTAYNLACLPRLLAA